ncbi:MAG: asparagine synthase (glutamine-hydrolyzing) [Pikeienuella sp.]
MCGISGLFALNNAPLSTPERDLHVMNALIAHRGPDGAGIWVGEQRRVGFAHRRLSIIDLSDDGAQPMHGENGATITYNGEIYNHTELRDTLRPFWSFKSKSDTECIIAAYAKWGYECVDYLRGMFAFAIHDKNQLFAVRDPFGIKPFYYVIIDNVFYFASEMKALLPFLPAVESDQEAMAEYLTLQYQISDQTLFKGIKVLEPGHALAIENGQLKIWKYWDVSYTADNGRSGEDFADELAALVEDSISAHMRSDVPVGAYVSGGIDSSLMAALSAKHPNSARKGFHGKFGEAPAYDESPFAEAACANSGIDLYQTIISSGDFERNIGRVIYHLDQPLAGPGSFPQYMVSELAAKHVKVVLGGQGGDEIFGGYARYMVGYLEQVLGGTIAGLPATQRLPLTLSDIAPNLSVLKEYKPLMGQLMSDNLFGPLDQRYYKLISRSGDMREEVKWEELNLNRVFERFQSIFNAPENVGEGSALDAMTHFDFKRLLPALLQVEDRMSMAHGLEARVPLLDQPIVELAASMPSGIKFPGGRLKNVLKRYAEAHLPNTVFNRRDKMGFPVPLREWYNGPLNGFIRDMFSSQKAKDRPFLRADAVLENFGTGGQFSRKTWGLMSLELWHQAFADRGEEFRRMRTANDIQAPQI